MKKFKEVIKLPSEAITAMCDGLLKQSKRKKFEIDMSNFGEDNGQVCFGCAATCTVQQVAGKNFKVGTIDFVKERSKFLGFDILDLNSFENAIDSIRCADLEDIFSYLDMNDEFLKNQDLILEIKNNLPVLRTYNWKKGIPYYRKAARELKKAGL